MQEKPTEKKTLKRCEALTESMMLQILIEALRDPIFLFSHV